MSDLIGHRKIILRYDPELQFTACVRCGALCVKIGTGKCKDCQVDYMAERYALKSVGHISRYTDEEAYQKAYEAIRNRRKVMTAGTCELCGGVIRDRQQICCRTRRQATKSTSW